MARRAMRPLLTSATSNGRSAGKCAGPYATTVTFSPANVVLFPYRSRASTTHVTSSPAMAAHAPNAATFAPGPLVELVRDCSIAVHPACESVPVPMRASNGHPLKSSLVSRQETAIL